MVEVFRPRQAMVPMLNKGHLDALTLQRLTDTIGGLPFDVRIPHTLNKPYRDRHGRPFIQKTMVFCLLQKGTRDNVRR